MLAPAKCIAHIVWGHIYLVPGGIVAGRLCERKIKSQARSTVNFGRELPQCPHLTAESDAPDRTRGRSTPPSIRMTMRSSFGRWEGLCTLSSSFSILYMASRKGHSFSSTPRQCQLTAARCSSAEVVDSSFAASVRPELAAAAGPTPPWTTNQWSASKHVDFALVCKTPSGQWRLNEP